MTREEAIFCEKSYIGETNCTDCKYYGTETCQSRESHRMAVKALEQEPISEWKQDHAILKAYSDGANEILDKLRAEIESKLDNINRLYNQDNQYDDGAIDSLQYALDIIDKYSECEGKK